MMLMMPAQADHRARPPPPPRSPADWCSACDGATCTACFERPQYGQASGRNKIELDPATKRVSGSCCWLVGCRLSAGRDAWPSHSPAELPLNCPFCPDRSA